MGWLEAGRCAIKTMPKHMGDLGVEDVETDNLFKLNRRLFSKRHQCRTISIIWQCGSGG